MALRSAEELLPDYALRNRQAPYFQAVTDAHGLYHTEQFVLRLSVRVHELLSETEPGIRTSGNLTFDHVRAMSTFLHETVHWWQHIGSTYGLMFSLVYPVQSHCTHSNLLQLTEKDGFKKSVLLQSLALGKTQPGGFGTTPGISNTIVNNHFDLLAFRTFTYGPKAAEYIAGQPLFEGVGHAFRLTYAHIVNTLGASVDPSFETIPHPRDWQEGFRDLTKQRVKGYYFKSPIDIWPVGAFELFEGQACLSQIQYLSHSSGHRATWADYRDLGILYGVYQQAFEVFLGLTESTWPDDVNDPLVGLFLLVCDISLNSGAAFPYPVVDRYDQFITDIHPGARFYKLCRTIAERFPHFKTVIKDHSRSEYEELSSQLCQAIGTPSTLAICQKFSDWFAPTGGLQSLRREFESYNFQPGNFPIRHLFAHFLAFQEDKLKRPEFFCWPGAWMAGDRVSEEVGALFSKHGAVFVDKIDNDGVFARLQAGRTEAQVEAAFSKFYHDSSPYNLTNQWISEPGKFKYDVSWLKPEATPQEAETYLRGQFENAYGLDPAAAVILEKE